MQPFRFVRNMQEWVFRTTTRGVEIVNITLLAHLTFALADSNLSAITPHGFTIASIDTSIAACVTAAMAAAQFTGLFSDTCSRCRKFSGLLLSLSAVVWLFAASVVYVDYTSVYTLGVGYAFAGVYTVVAVLCYLAAEVIREYVKMRME